MKLGEPQDLWRRYRTSSTGPSCGTNDQFGVNKHQNHFDLVWQVLFFHFRNGQWDKWDKWPLWINGYTLW